MSRVTQRPFGEPDERVPDGLAIGTLAGNPGGRTKQFAQCQRLCREAPPDAARRLIELMQSEDERVALMAADKVFERAWGRPKDYDPNAEAWRRKPSEPQRPTGRPWKPTRSRASTATPREARRL